MGDFVNTGALMAYGQRCKTALEELYLLCIIYYHVLHDCHVLSGSTGAVNLVNSQPR